MQNIHLFHVLANTHFLSRKTQNYHWNVKGKNFYQLHKLFEDQYIQLEEALDVIAERIRAKGEIIPEFKDDQNKIGPLQSHASDQDMVKDLMHSHQELMKLIDVVDDVHDRGTSSLLDERSASHEKAIWMLGSVLSLY